MSWEAQGEGTLSLREGCVPRKWRNSSWKMLACHKSGIRPHARATREDGC